jgi:hypothetical protein
MATSAQSTLGTIEQFIGTVGARQKQAEANTEPGSIGGATSHPVKNVDDRTEPAKEGARSKENTTDVKEDQGKLSVESAPEATAKSAAALLAGFAKKAEGGGAVSTPGSAADDHLQIGTNVQPTGDDKSNETSSAKAGKEDPGSTHPARTDNTALDGHKYAGDDGLKKIAAEIERGEVSFPTSTVVGLRLKRLLDDPDCPLERAARLVQAEPLLAAKVVAVANSTACNRSGRSITDVRTAVIRLGFRYLRALASAVVSRQLAAPATARDRELADRLWEHTAHVAALARSISRSMKSRSRIT